MRVSEFQSSDSLLITGNVFLRQLRNRSGRKWKCHSLSWVWLFATLWTIAWQGLQSIEFSKSKNTGVGYHFLPQGSSWSRDQTWVSCIAGIFFIVWANKEVVEARPQTSKLSPLGNPLKKLTNCTIRDTHQNLPFCDVSTCGSILLC